MQTETNNTTTTVETTSPFDPRPSYAQACAIAGPIIEQVTDEHLRSPTPCSEFDVEALTRHLLSIGHRTLALGRGEAAETIPLDAPGVENGDFGADWRASLEAQATQWADERLLGRPMILPFGTLPGAVALAIYAAEILVHAWDLATALGLEPEWDQDLAAEALHTVQMGVPAEGRGPEMPFDPVTPTDDDAPAMDRLVAWVGRKP